MAIQGMDKIRAAIAAAKAKAALQADVGAILDANAHQPAMTQVAAAVAVALSPTLVEEEIAYAMHQPVAVPLAEMVPANSEIVTLLPAADAPIAQLQVPNLVKHADGTYTIHGRLYNKKQSEAITRVAYDKESICLIGPAGCGKTTNIQGVAYAMIENGLPVLGSDTKFLRAGSPGVLVLSFTRRAVANIKRYMPAELKPNTMTFHKVLEYQPVYFEEYDSEKGKLVNKRRFEPQRNRHNPLPASIKVIFVEETSMLGLELIMKLWDALPYPERVQWVFLGDINQLPPVFSKGIFGFKLIELPVVELTEIYRQALDSPGLRLAHAIKNGEAIYSTKNSKGRHVPPEEWNHPGKLTIRYWQGALEEDLALLTAAKFFTTGVEQDYYNPAEDMILIPKNVAFGSIELGKMIAQYLGTQRKAVVHEVVAGFAKHYLAVGDKILYDKEDAIIEEIVVNEAYMGAKFQEPSIHLDRWGVMNAPKDYKHELAVTADDDDYSDIDFLLSQAGDEDRVHAASHKIKLRYVGISRDIDAEEGEESYEWIDKAAQINNIISGYVMTVHKSQGCEWRRVFVIMHKSHSGMVSREIIYTAATRFREELVMLLEPDSGTLGTRGFKPGSLARAITYQEVPGNNLEEKLSYFRIQQMKALKQLQNEEDKGEQQKLLAIIGPKIRAHIKEQVEEHLPAIKAKVEETWEKLLAIYPDKGLPKYELYVDTAIGNAAGTVQHKIGVSILTIDSLYFLQDPKEALARTIPHEVCHIADGHWFNGTGHGQTWKKLMKDLGFVPDREIMHEMGNRQDNMKKVAAKLV